MKEEIRKKDRQQSFSRCDEKSPLIAQVAGEVGWDRLWDACLRLGEKYTTGLKKLSRLMSHHGRGKKKKKKKIMISNFFGGLFLSSRILKGMFASIFVTC